MAIVAAATGSLSRIDARASSACGPAIHGTVRASVAGAPEAKTIARPFGSALRSATSRTRSRRVAWLVDLPPLPCETDVVSRSKSPIGCESSERNSTSETRA